MICRCLQVLVSVSLWQPNIRIGIRAVTLTSGVWIPELSPVWMNGFSVPHSWHQLCYVNLPILAGSAVPALRDHRLPACPECQKDFLWHLQPSSRASASLTGATRIWSCWQCWQCSAWRSRSWLEVLQGLGPSQAPRVFLWEDWGELEAAPVPQPCSRTAWLLPRALLGREGAKPACAWEQEKRRECEPLLCCTNKNSSNLITWNISINWYESDD